MFDEQLRDTKEIVFIRLAAALHIFALHPIAITGIALIFGLAAVICISQQQFGLGFLFWLLNRIFDGLDGTVARVQDLQSDLGGYIDILADFLIYALIPIGLAWARPETAVFLSLALLLASFYVNGASWMYLSAILEKRKQKQLGQKTSINMPSGLIGGAETIVFYSLFILIPQWVVPLFLIMSGLVALTIGQRLVWAVNHLQEG